MGSVVKIQKEASLQVWVSEERSGRVIWESSAYSDDN